MAPHYIPPGVTITEAVQPQIVPLVTSTAELVIVGQAGGVQTRTDQIVVGKAGTEQALPYLAQVPHTKLVGEKPIKTVINTFHPSEPSGSKGKGYKEGESWEIKSEKFVNKEGEHPIPEGTVVSITYTFIAGNYYNPIRLFDASEVQSRFGEPIVGGKVASPLSLAATKAFENGAQTVICQPLFKTSSGSLEYNQLGYIVNGEALTEEEAEEPTHWATTLQALGTVEVIDILVPVSGVEEVLDKVLQLEQDRAYEQQYVFGVYGTDTTVTAKTAAEIRTLAKALAGYASGAYSQQNILINTSSFNVRASQSEEIQVGGQYVAAAIAGKMAGSPASQSLTRQPIGGFRAVNDHRNSSEKNLDAENGLMVVEEIKGGSIRIRHGITIDTEGGAARSEVSVVRAKFNVIESIRETLENQVIGKIIADSNAPVIVRSAISAVLAVLERTRQIVGYNIPEVKVASLEPTTLVASFSYRPAFTVNYIDIVFQLDLSSQSVTVFEEQKV